MPEPRQLPVYAVATRPRLVAKVLLLPIPRQLLAKGPHRVRGVGDRPVEAHCGARRGLDHRNRNRLLVYVQTNEKGKFRHGPPRSVPGDRLLYRSNPRSVAKRLTRHFEAGHLNRLPPLTDIWSCPRRCPSFYSINRPRRERRVEPRLIPAAPVNSGRWNGAEPSGERAYRANHIRASI